MKQTFEENIKKFKNSGEKNYFFLTRAGKKFQNIVFLMCKRMLKQEEFPESFSKTTLHIIFKGKGRREELSRNRFIHCKEWWPRVAESLLVEDGLKGPLIEGSSIFQIGGQPGHRSEDLMFVLKSLVARQRRQGKMIILQSYDISKFFDKERIEDAVVTCLNQKADPKAVRLWLKLNQCTKIQVRTGAGMTKYAEVGAVVGQGMLGGALVSQGVLDEAVMEHLPPGEPSQMVYGKVALAPLIWMDDFISNTDELAKARSINTKVAYLIKQKGLSLNEEKSVCLIIGSKKQQKKAT